MGTAKTARPKGLLYAEEIAAILDGPREIDAGYFYCPYIPLTSSGEPLNLELEADNSRLDND